MKVQYFASLLKKDAKYWTLMFPVGYKAIFILVNVFFGKNLIEPKSYYKLAQRFLKPKTFVKDIPFDQKNFFRRKIEIEQDQKTDGLFHIVEQTVFSSTGPKRLPLRFVKWFSVTENL